VIVAAFACAVVAASAAPAHAAIAFRAASTAFTTIPAVTLPITVPASAVSGDLLLAAITVRSATLTA